MQTGLTPKQREALEVLSASASRACRSRSFATEGISADVIGRLATRGLVALRERSRPSAIRSSVPSMTDVAAVARRGR